MNPGPKTTEFWTTGATAAGLLATGAGSADWRVQCVAMAGAALVSIGYAIARAIEKRAAHLASAEEDSP